MSGFHPVFPGSNPGNGFSFSLCMEMQWYILYYGSVKLNNLWPIFLAFVFSVSEVLGSSHQTQSLFQLLVFFIAVFGHMILRFPTNFVGIYHRDGAL